MLKKTLTAIGCLAVPCLFTLSAVKGSNVNDNLEPERREFSHVAYTGNPSFETDIYGRDHFLDYGGSLDHIIRR